MGRATPQIEQEAWEHELKTALQLRSRLRAARRVKKCIRNTSLDAPTECGRHVQALP